MKALLFIALTSALTSVLTLAITSPAQAEDTHCPQYACIAEASNGMTYQVSSYTLGEARYDALNQCSNWSGGLRCRVVACSFHRMIDVWGACFDAAQ